MRRVSATAIFRQIRFADLLSNPDAHPWRSAVISVNGRNHISWVSLLGRALMKSAAGDSVVLQLPGGTEYLTVLEVSLRAHFCGIVP